MTRALLVYAWTDHRPGHGQVRAIMAAHSIAEVLRTAHMSRREWENYGTRTGNETEQQMAFAKPHTVLWQPLRSRDPNEWFYDQ
jgi:hypothetical protein